MSTGESKKKSGIALFELSTSFFATFLTLKLTHTGIIGDWSYWRVASPLWICFIINFLIRMYHELNR